jgi:hypothetical protein
MMKQELGIDPPTRESEDEKSGGEGSREVDVVFPAVNKRR